MDEASSVHLRIKVVGSWKASF